MTGNNWLCPFCNSYSVVTDANRTINTFTFRDGSKYGGLHLVTTAITCPSDACGESEIVTTLSSVNFATSPGAKTTYSLMETLHLRPDHIAKIYPSYVPAPIIEDYTEACKIKMLSPKASATLSRRCLQGIIRDFWGVRKKRLIDEISALKEIIDSDTWAAIDALRQVGNIGAHMEMDINTIVEVDADEAAHLISLIELLIEDSYIARHKRQSTLAKVVQIAAGKTNKE